MPARQHFLPTAKLELDFTPQCLGEYTLVLDQVREQGLTLPFPVVRRSGKCIVKGRELYFLAARELGLRRVPVTFIEDEREYDRLLLGTLLGPQENPLDTARRIRQCQERYSINQTRLGQEFGVSQPLISKYLRLLDCLYSATIDSYVGDLRVADGSRNHRDNPRSRQGAADIGLRHLLELTRLHHKYSGLSPQRSELLQTRMLRQMTTKCPSVANLKRMIKGTRPSQAMSPTSKISQVPMIQVYNANARHLLQVIPHGSAHLVITSPPYHLHKPYETQKSLVDYLEDIVPPLQCAAMTLGSRRMVLSQYH